jgi:hypothetical protein
MKNVVDGSGIQPFDKLASASEIASLSAVLFFMKGLATKSDPTIRTDDPKELPSATP